MKLSRPGVVLAAWTMALGAASTTLAQQGATMEPQTQAQAARQIVGWASDLWSKATSGQTDSALNLLGELPAGAGEVGLGSLAQAVDRYRTNIEQREASRAARIAEVHAELEKYPDLKLMDAIRDVIELHTLSLDKKTVLNDPVVRDVVDATYATARKHEANGEWLEAYDLIRGLHVLYEEDGRYKEDHNRLSQRLLMLQLYTPELLHDMRSAQMVADGEDPLPPFNPIDGTWRDKLANVNERMVLEPLSLSANYHVDEVEGADLLLGGLRGVETLVNTPDLAVEFPLIKDDLRRQTFLQNVAEARTWVENRRGRVSLYDMITLLRTVMRANDDSVSIPEQVLLHEFGNGAMACRIHRPGSPPPGRVLPAPPWNTGGGHRGIPLFFGRSRMVTCCLVGALNED